MVRVSVLGPLAVEVGGHVVEIAGRRERRVLAVLAVHAGRSVSTATLSEYLWGDAPPRTADKSLQGAVANLRKTVATAGGPDRWLVTTDHGYRLDGVVTDLEELASLRSAGAFARAEALWRGDEPAGLGDGVLATATMARLRADRSELRVERLRAELDAGRARAALTEVEAAVDVDPLDERLTLLLMEALYQQGNQAEALAAAERHRSALLEGHGLDAGPAVRHLERRILEHDPGLAGNETGGVAPPERRPPSAAGVGGGGGDAGALFGRDEDLEGVARALDKARVVTLVGPGGVGKTALARAVVNATAGEADVVWCNLGSVLDPERVVPAIATACGVTERAGATMAEAISDRLALPGTLLVLDNCEHVLDEVAGLLRAAPAVRVLATSREPLRLTGEQLWPLDGLRVPAADEDPREADAVRLFIARARRADPLIHMSDTDLEAISRICRAVDGLPLAIELAAARVRALPPREIVRRLDDRLELLSGGPRDSDDRHRSLWALVGWSYDLLGERQQRLLRRLGTFAGSFTSEAAEVVAAAPAGSDAGATTLMVADLVDKSLVTVERRTSGSYYRLLETVRVFARAARDDAGEEEACNVALVAFLAQEVPRLGRMVRGPDEVHAVDGLRAAFDNIRHAVDLAGRHGRRADLLRLLSGLAAYLRSRISWEASSWLETAVVICEGTDVDRADLARVRSLAAWTAALAGDLDKAARHLAPVNDASTAVDLPDDVVLSIQVARCLREMYGNVPSVVTTAAEVRRLAERIGDPWEVAYACGTHALVLGYHGRRTEAEAALVAQADAVRRVGNESSQAWWWYCSAEVSGEHDPARTVELARRGVEIARRADAVLIETVAQITAVTVAARHGRAAEVVEEMASVIDRCWRQGAWTHLMVTIQNLVEALALTPGAEVDAARLLHALPEAVTAYGEQGERLAAVADTLRTALGDDAYEAAAAQGHVLDRAGVAVAALGALDHLRG